MKCDVTKRKEEPNKVKARPTAPLVLISVPGLVAKLAVLTAMAKKQHTHIDQLQRTNTKLHSATL